MVIKGNPENVYFKDYSRYKGIANWVITDSPAVIQETKVIYRIFREKEAFKNFNNKFKVNWFSETIENIYDNTLEYLLIENMKKEGEIRIKVILFKIIFRRFKNNMNFTYDKSYGLKEQIREEDITTSEEQPKEYKEGFKKSD